MRTIYGLVDPRTDAVRYVGMTRNVSQRRSAHAWDAAHGSAEAANAKVAWLAELHAAGLKAGFIVLELIPLDADWREVERRWIASMPDLVNGSRGGDGNDGGGGEHPNMATLRMSAGLALRIAAFAKKQSCTFSDALRRLVIAGLAVEEART